jgi:hypothetical protein
LLNGVGDWIGKSSTFERFSNIPVVASYEHIGARIHWETRIYKNNLD